MNKKEVKIALLHQAGKQFGTIWLESQNNPNLEGFEPSAETYFRQLRESLWMKVLGCIFATLGFSLMAPAINPHAAEEIMVTSVIVLFGLIIFTGFHFFYKSLRTRRELAKAWKPIRETILSLGVLNKTSKSERWLLEEQLRDRLVSLIGQTASKIRRGVRKAEQEQQDVRAQKLYSKFEKLKELAQELGLKMTF